MDRQDYLAHIAEDGREQTVQQHSRAAAKYASDALDGIDLSNTAYLAGLLHDAGKFKLEFTEYLLDAVMRKKTVKRGSVNHTFAGVRFTLERWHKAEELSYCEIAAELLAFAIGAHHGLFDCVDEKRELGFLYRQTKDGIHYEESIKNFLTQCANHQELGKLFLASVEELTPVIDKLSALSQQSDDEMANSEMNFYIGLLGRMLLSAVIDGDRRDTAEFQNNQAFCEWPCDMQKIWSLCLEKTERKLQEFPADQPIQKARHRISDACRNFAEQPGGVYRLKVPTGGGKTLSSLRYALAHSKKWNKSRIIFTSPLLSILDQNAQVIRDYIADDSLILEHHSNLVKPKETFEQLSDLELLTDTWHSPIIITTLVQLLNTLFSGKTACIRRFQALCNSVIVIDEVQTVPNNLLTLFNLAVNFLSEVCGATIVLCSATQPSLETVAHPLSRTPQDIVPWDQQLWNVFKRTQIQDEGQYRLEELPQLIENCLKECNSLLVVCNKKDESKFLFQSLSNQNIQRFHLSAAMCAAHRRDTLQALQTALEEGSICKKKVVCISTQVIEASVDISFQRVIRFAAGMDSVIQSAGRCNRNAESNTPERVSIVQCTDESLSRLEDIRRGQNATVALLDAFRKSPQRFCNDLASKEAIDFYYHKLYQNMNENFQDYAVKEYESSIFHFLADNPKYADKNCAGVNRYFLRQAFQLAGRLFQVFDQETTDVLVPYGKGREIREALIATSNAYGCPDYASINELINEAKLYSVSLYQYQLDRLSEYGALIPLFDGSVYALADGFYDKNTGFSLKNGSTELLEV
ncbi:MAG: CRISPR-associated helicase Cas3' [Eubacteriales bacterium]